MTNNAKDDKADLARGNGLTKKGRVVDTPIAAEMKQLAATLLGVRGRNWRKEVLDVASPWVPSSMRDDQAEMFKQMPAGMQLRVRAADLIGLVLIGEAEFLSVWGDELDELRALSAKAARPLRRRAA
jgi:hypothetical protein